MMLSFYRHSESKKKQLEAIEESDSVSTEHNESDSYSDTPKKPKHKTTPQPKKKSHKEKKVSVPEEQWIVVMSFMK